MKQQIVIIGTGLAGYTLGREFRKINSNAELTYITNDDGIFYSKPMLSNAIASRKTISDLVMQTHDQMAMQLNATIHTNTKVTKIDTQSQAIQFDNKSISYDKLVLATGANPISPFLEGNATEQIHKVNNLGDYARFRNALEGTKSIGIIGAGMIGCEFANDLIQKDYNVNVIMASKVPLGHLVPEPIGEYIEKSLNKLCVNWYSNTTVKAVNQYYDQKEIILDSGESLIVDVVLSAIGIKPDLSLAKEANIKTNQGIVTNAFLETSEANVYALGDCAEIEGNLYQFVLPIMSAAKVLAKSLNGEPEKINFPVMPVTIKTPACPTVISLPDINTKGEWACEISENGVRCLYKDYSSRLQGFVLCGDFCKERQNLTKRISQVF